MLSKIKFGSGKFRKIFVGFLSFSFLIFLPHITRAEWTWQIEIVESGGSHTSIAIDSLDSPHISHHLGGAANHDLLYAKWNGSSWSKQTVEWVDDVGYDNSIALDNSGNPHISYYDYTNGDLKHAKRTGSSWSISPEE